MTEQYGPKKMGARADQPVCILCRKPIQPRETYHYLTRKRKKYLHTYCYAKEVARHD